MDREQMFLDYVKSVADIGLLKPDHRPTILAYAEGLGIKERKANILIDAFCKDYIREKARQSIDNGYISSTDYYSLKFKAEEMGISDTEYESIINEEKYRAYRNQASIQSASGILMKMDDRKEREKLIKILENKGNARQINEMLDKISAGKAEEDDLDELLIKLSDTDVSKEDDSLLHWIDKKSSSLQRKKRIAGGVVKAAGIAATLLVGKSLLKK